ncbi:TIGR02444 family protein [Ferrovibrio xuzhouensis]|uniref:TIGR02444 family protein n=1 Tax=Ferrovibrio xuzhouensis TaxID=1576914 RepID=A0ABV7VAZ5_9PROT
MSEPGTLAKDGNQPPADGGFWRFSLALYGRPGAAAACLALQDRCGADVTLLLLGFWRAHKGFPGWADGELARVTAALAPVNAVQRPLRQARRALKALQADEPAAPALYGEIKALELRLEQVAQVWALGACRASPAFRDPEPPGREAEIAAAAQHLSASLDMIAPGDAEALQLGAALLDAAFAA